MVATSQIMRRMVTGLGLTHPSMTERALNGAGAEPGLAVGRLGASWSITNDEVFRGIYTRAQVGEAQIIAVTSAIPVRASPRSVLAWPRRSRGTSQRSASSW